MKRFRSIDVGSYSAALATQGVPLSPLVVAAGMAYVSGMPPMDLETGAIRRGDIIAQTETVLANISSLLASVDASLDDIVCLRIYCSNSGYYDAINTVYARHFRPPYPARTFVPTSGWPRPFDIEIDCIAVLESEDHADH